MNRGGLSRNLLRHGASFKGYKNGSQPEIEGQLAKAQRGLMFGKAG
jgi:hypothetical protein